MVFNNWIFLNAENGSALFGKQGVGQIIIDPTVNKGLLYSYNFWKNYGEDGLPTSYNSSNEAGHDGEGQAQSTGMLIDLTTPEIRFGNGNFKVDSTGYTTMRVAQIGEYTRNQSSKGPIYVGKSGDGFSAIYTGTKNKKNVSQDGFYVGVNGISLGQLTTYNTFDYSTWTEHSTSACKFQVDADGTLYAMDGIFNGKIYSNDGVIGGWVITSGGIVNYSGSDEVVRHPMVVLNGRRVRFLWSTRRANYFYWWR